MRLHTLKLTLAALACLGMLAGPLLADNPDRLLSLPDAGRPLIHDVALDANKSLHGVVRDVNGKLQPNTDVSLWRGAVIVQRARTDQFGRFAFRGLRGSTYRIGTAVELYRHRHKGTANGPEKQVAGRHACSSYPGDAGHAVCWPSSVLAGTGTGISLSPSSTTP